MAALILFQLGLGLAMTRLVADPLERFALTQTHKSWGAVILALAVLRIGWRLGARARPDLPAAMPRWQRRAARISHGGLYVLMLALPLSGWILASAAPEQDLLRIENRFFGTVALPDPFVPGSAAVANIAGNFHAAAAALLAALLAVHVGAAIRHQFVDRDGVLARMMFGE
jgi:cytochrome b561